MAPATTVQMGVNGAQSLGKRCHIPDSTPQSRGEVGAKQVLEPGHGLFDSGLEIVY